MYPPPPPGFAASLIVATVFLLVASPAAAQLPEEQRAYDAIRSADAAFRRASDSARMLQAAEQVLQAAEGARSAFRAGDRDRKAANERYRAADQGWRAAAAACAECHTGQPAAWGQGRQPSTGSFTVDGFYLPYMDAQAEVATANADYVQAVGISEIGAARERVARTRAFANRMRGFVGRDARDYLLRANALTVQGDAELKATEALHRRATTAHVATNRAALDALARAGRTLMTAAERLTDYNYYEANPGDVTRAAEALGRSLSAAYGANTSEDGDRTAEALDGIVSSAQQTMNALRSHLQVVERAASEYEQGTDSLQERVASAPSPQPAVESQPPTSLADWMRRLRHEVSEVDEWANAAESAASGFNSRFSRSRDCNRAVGRLQQAAARANRLLTRRSEFVPADADFLPEIRQRISAGISRGVRACASIWDR